MTQSDSYTQPYLSHGPGNTSTSPMRLPLATFAFKFKVYTQAPRVQGLLGHKVKTRHIVALNKLSHVQLT
eukprot:1149736-Pelagomonas_calceolata.AAC.2